MNAMRINSPRVRPNDTSPYYHGVVVYVRKGGEEASRACEPEELAAEDGSVPVGADTLISGSAEGPFVPLAVAIEGDVALRDAFARAIPLRSLVAWGRLRFVVLGLALIPLLMVLELDRELVSKGLFGKGRPIIDLLLAAYVVFELTRRTPRLPGVAAAALLAVGMRWLLVVTRLCGKNVHPAVWVAAFLSLGAAFVIFARAPTRARVSLELLSKLGISRSDVAAARKPDPVSTALVVAAAAAAAGLPLLLWALRKNAFSVAPQAAFFVLYALVVPEIIRRVFARTSGAAEPSPRINVAATLLAIGVGVTLTAALLHGTHQFFDAGGELARCTGRLDEASRRLLNAEASELSRRITSVRASTALVIMTTCVMPLAEERIYRGLLMNVLVRRYGLTYGLFVSAAAFGFAHVGIYEIALYQTILLGIGFGFAYLEGGLVAAFVVHAVWNLLNVA